jgi:hypothetical protein
MKNKIQIKAKEKLLKKEIQKKSEKEAVEKNDTKEGHLNQRKETRNGIRIASFGICNAVDSY